ncbi:probable RNA-binding protein 18 [Leptinotarsa decemlineata]|uniref:probable RNA-binding protein 18 n=1 Tax=Leptinotarsa decemlineata TaxID=7539 RepID=UPI000C2545DF|nr:probable RNA-binding protein 18 [Leptinotarsa decemlineata]XP_023016118.1 probable RNA-binding protein 18 [Leptinotarsa decemlineata]XP_023016119.1 probable RNA-binding protein 18 [Leptinotarsa decemlineata]
MESTKRVNINLEERRLWIGNLDPRVTEYQLLKLVQKHGDIEKFDLIFHRNGPQAGLPRGYAFVTYIRKEDALSAKNALNNLHVGEKSIIVTWAHSMNNEEIEKPKEEIFIPALAISKEGKKADRVSQIQAIEAKLKLMEKKAEDELKINDSVATKQPVIVQYQSNKIQSINSTSGSSNFRHKQNSRRRDRHSKPYSRNKLNR